MRQVEFIEALGRVWVPRPTSWLGGWARHSWLKRHFGEGKVSIASPKYWTQLKGAYGSKILSEEDGVYKVKDNIIT